jgi:hypothetical protein
MYSRYSLCLEVHVQSLRASIRLKTVPLFRVHGTLCLRRHILNHRSYIPTSEICTANKDSHMPSFMWLELYLYNVYPARPGCSSDLIVIFTS